MKKILVPVDFSEQASAALDLALQLAPNKKDKVTLIHVIEVPMGGLIDTTGVTLPPAYQPEFMENLFKDRKAKMSKFLSKSGISEADVEIKTEIGNTYVCISDEINKNQYDLLVMGTKGASGFKEFFIGSNTEKMVRTAHCPIIAIHRHIDVNQIRDIVFATHGIVESTDLMEHVNQLQRMFKAKLHILRVNTPDEFERDAVSKQRLQELTEKYDLKNYTINIYNDINENEGIIEFAKLIGANMIAMGTHGRKGLDHLAMGSLTEDVVNHAPDAIWSYRIKK